MSTLIDNDVFLIQQNGVTKTVLNKNRSTLDPDNDIFLVQRSGVTHTIKAGDVGGGGVTGSIDTPVAVLTPLNGAGTNDGQPYQPLSTEITAVGAGGEVVFATDTIENVGVADAWNQSAVWSSYWTGTAGYGAFLQVHDANEDGYVQSLDATLTFPSAISCNSLSIRHSQAFGTAKLFVNETDVTDQLPTGSGYAISPITGFTSISTIRVTGSDYASNIFTLSRIYINGQVLVDTGIPGDPGAGTLLTFPEGATNFDKFERGDVVQDPDVKVTAIDDTVPSITVDGGSWYGADGTGDAGGETTVSKTVTSEASLTFTDNTELANMVGPLSQVDENGNVKTPVTSEIESVGVAPASFTTSGATANWQFGCNQDLSLLGAFPNCGPETQGYLGGRIYTTQPGATLVFTFSGADGNPGLIYNKSIVIYSFSNRDSNEVLGTFDDGVVTLPYENNKVSATEFNPYTRTGSGRLLSVSYGGTSGNSMSAGLVAIVIDGYQFTQTNGTAEGGDLVFGPTLTFKEPNPDLKYFSSGDQIGTASGFLPVIYTGNGGTQSITGVGFSPDLVWIKARTTTAVTQHVLMDSVRGNNEMLCSNSTGAATDFGSPPVWGYVSSFDSDGFTIAPGGTGIDQVGQSGANYVAWCWDAGDTTVTNNDGTIESQVRSNGNFSVVAWNGNGTDNQSVGHGLNSAPGLAIFKRYTGGTSNWQVWHQSLGNTQRLALNTTEPAISAGTVWGNGMTSSVLGIGSGSGVNTSGSDYVAYAWAETPGVTSLGSYIGKTGNPDNTGGPVIECGFKPAFVMIKRTESTAAWIIQDSARNPTSPFTQKLGANTSVDENNVSELGGPTESNIIYTDTGFQIFSNGAVINANGETYIYAAFADSNPIEVIDVNVAANTMTVDGDGYVAGDTITGPPLIASANDVEYLDGNTLGVSGVSGSWMPGLHAQGAEITASAPSPESIQYTSANGDPLTTQFTGTDATLTTRTWTWQVSEAVTGPWSDFATKIDTPGQDGDVPLADRPTLEPNKFYRVMVQYDSNNAEYVESEFNTFKTGDA